MHRHNVTRSEITDFVKSLGFDPARVETIEISRGSVEVVQRVADTHDFANGTLDGTPDHHTSPIRLPIVKDKPKPAPCEIQVTSDGSRAAEMLVDFVRECLNNRDRAAT